MLLRLQDISFSTFLLFECTVFQFHRVTPFFYQSFVLCWYKLTILTWKFEFAFAHQIGFQTFKGQTACLAVLPLFWDSQLFIRVQQSQVLIDQFYLVVIPCNSWLILNPRSFKVCGYIAMPQFQDCWSSFNSSVMPRLSVKFLFLEEHLCNISWNDLLFCKFWSLLLSR